MYGQGIITCARDGTHCLSLEPAWRLNANACECNELIALVLAACNANQLCAALIVSVSCMQCNWCRERMRTPCLSEANDFCCGAV